MKKEELKQRQLSWLKAYLDNIWENSKNSKKYSIEETRQQMDIYTQKLITKTIES